MMIAIVVAAGALIAFANGQNDVSKGIATLVGSGVTDHRRAILTLPLAALLAVCAYAVLRVTGL